MTQNLAAEPAKFALKLVGGATWDITFPLVTTAGAPADLSGYSVEAEIRAPGQANANWTATISGSNVRLRLTAAQTRAFTWNNAAFDVLLVGSAATVVPIAGTIKRIRPVTIPG